MADFGYDVSNYHDIDPIFRVAGRFTIDWRVKPTRGIRLVLDMVMNHTSNQHHGLSNLAQPR
jgi:alpha-glucosidase